MKMRRLPHDTTTLPKRLQEELGLQNRHIQFNGRAKSRNNERPVARKERRKEEKAAKKAAHRPNTTRQVQRHAREPSNEKQGYSENDSDDEPESRPVPAPQNTNGALKSILKKQKPSNQNSSRHKSTPSPPAIIQQRPSKGIRDRLAEDDAEIEALEKTLGLEGKKGKLPKAFEEDGLDELLEGLDTDGSDVGERKRKRGGDEEWLRRKRRRAQGLEGVGSEDEDEDESLGDKEEGDSSEISDKENRDDNSEESDFSGFSSSSSPPPTDKPKRENSYIAPTTLTTTTKYAPSSLRAPSTSDSESVVRLRRQVQGLLNRLSESNLVSVLGDVEKLYRDYPRHSVTTALADLILDLTCDKASLQDAFIILHAGFIAAVYKVVSTDFGAGIVSRIVDTFDRFYVGGATSKETINLLSLLSSLYNFHIIGSTLIFDYIRLFLRSTTEINTELLLKIIRVSGPQLRQDDPSALKDIVLMIQPAVAQTGEANLSLRTRFMIETITDLKNNRMKTGVVGSVMMCEHIIRMRKILGSLSTSRTMRTTEPLSIGLDDIRNSDKRGKWWLVGASWKENDDGTNIMSRKADLEVAQSEDEEHLANESTNLLSLARQHRMNTDIRRSIFVAIMSASDYQDAHIRLLKLRLKRNQEVEIPRVLMHCAGAEETHNPYYTLIARKLCSKRKLKMAFQFALWDLFKRMGERGDVEEGDYEPDDESEGIEMKTIVSLAKMFGTLVADGGLALGVLKTLCFAYLQERTMMFLEVMLITVILESQRRGKGVRDEKVLADVFARVRETPGMGKGLRWFIKKAVRKTDLAGSKKDRETVRWGCGVAIDTLAVLQEKSAGMK